MQTLWWSELLGASPGLGPRVSASLGPDPAAAAGQRVKGLFLMEEGKKNLHTDPKRWSWRWHVQVGRKIKRCLPVGRVLGGSRALLSTPKACRAPTKPGWVLHTGTMTGKLDSQAGGT